MLIIVLRVLNKTKRYMGTTITILGRVGLYFFIYFLNKIDQSIIIILAIDVNINFKLN